MSSKMSKSSASSSSSQSSSSASGEKPEPKTKIDPSFKSKRYRDKLRTEVKALETLLPVDRTSLSRKLDSQTVFRLVLALLRIKGYFQAAGQQPDSFPVASRPYDVITGNKNEDTDDVTSLVQGLACLQVLEGFLLVLTADGTILYVSDNVLQYLGYNQVDLMHRCLYSIVHRDDMMDLKMVLETSLAHLVTRYEHPGVQQEACHRLEECGSHVGSCNDTCASLSFICRMRCFSGSSVGYLKMHCSGKMVHQPSLPKGKRSSNNVVLLFCNPFMLRAAEFTPDLQKNVFWSKHELDLHVKEMDAKGADIIGFKPEEIEKQSFYTLVHPEDLTALASCHKLLMESSEVQTVYFRLQTKGGDWLWLTSRGKVISKNSKKFSIAFSHCPLREEDSTYIQQEAVLRRRFAVTDLMYLNQLRQAHPPEPLTFSPAPNHFKEAQQPGFSSGSKLRRAAADGGGYPPCGLSATSGGGSGVGRMGGGKGEGKKEEVGVLDTSCVLEVACPSAWHAMSDRHSPVLPSSHVAHKITQREKQLQFQEFCKRQQMDTNGSANGQTKFTNTWDGMPPYSAAPAQELATSRTVGQDTVSSAPPTGVVGGCSSNPDPPGFYPGSSNFGGFGSCVEYSPVTGTHLSSCAPSSVHLWYSGGSVSMSHPSPADCLTPSRSPHQCSRRSNMAGLVSNQVANQLAVFQPPPPAYGSVPIPQTVAVPAYSSMPPSPPPSPPMAVPVVPQQQTVEMEPGSSCVQQQYYWPEFFQSWQPCFSFPTPQPPSPYHRNNNGAASSSHPLSTITDLQKTTEKFLPRLKKERQYQNEEAVPELHGEIQSHAEQTEDSCHSVPDRWGRAAWTFNGQLDISWRSSTASMNSFRQVNVNGSVNLQQSVTNYSESQTHGHHGFQNTHFTPNHMLHASMSQPAPQSYPYPSLYPHLGSPPAYPYGVYPQLGYQSSQYPVNSFYTATPSVSMKMPAEFARPAVERPLDLPSIGSFLEYLNEV